MTMIITNSANTQISVVCSESNKKLRLSVIAGGCHGFNKVWELDDVINDDDYIYQTDNGILLIDPVTLDIIHDATVDYKCDLSGSYFSLEIPKVSSTCGCGSSFSI